MELNIILKGNALEVLKTLPNSFIDCVMTSPPYYMLRDYGENAKCDTWQGQLGLEPSWELYVQHLTQIFEEVKRILKDSGSLWLNIGDTYFNNNHHKEKSYFKGLLALKNNVYKQKCLMGIPWRVAFELIKNGWILRNAVIWYKPNHMPASVKDRLTNTYEYIFHFVKSQKYYYNLNTIRIPFKTTFDLENERIRKLINRLYEIVTQIRNQVNSNGKSNNVSGWTGTSIHRNAYHKALKILEQEETLTNTEKKFLTEYAYKHLSHPEGINPGDLFEINTRPYHGAHFAVFPPELCIVPILATCPPNGIVADIFAGAGTTLAVAKALGRKYIGIEIVDKYINIAEKRLKKLEWPLMSITKRKDAEDAIKRIYMGA